MVLTTPDVLVPTASAVGVLFAIFLWARVSNIKLTADGSGATNGRAYLLEEEQRGDDEVGLL
jgi:inorganic pyrophosphatase